MKNTKPTPSLFFPESGIISLLLACLSISLASCGRETSHRLMTFQEYREIDHPVPYILRLEQGERGLLYFGARHVFDPADLQIDAIERMWEEFHPTVAFNEGGNPPVLATREEAVGRIGEPGWVRFLAARDGVPVFSLEPEREVETAHLVRRFTPEEVKVFYILRQIPQWRNSRDPRPLADRLENMIGGLSLIQELAGAPRDYGELAESCVRVVPEIPDCLAITREWFDPVPDVRKGITNDISAEASWFRDLHMLDLLIDRVRRGERVFAVVGASHVVMQERPLRRALEPR